MKPVVCLSVCRTLITARFVSYLVLRFSLNVDNLTVVNQSELAEMTFDSVLSNDYMGSIRGRWTGREHEDLTRVSGVNIFIFLRI